MRREVLTPQRCILIITHDARIFGFADRIAHVKGELGRHGIPFEFVFEHDADELDEARGRAEAAEQQAERLRDDLAKADNRAIAVLEALAAKIESLAAK